MKYLINLGALLTFAFIAQSTYALPEDTSKPLEIQANEAFFDQNTGEATYKGDVFVKQGTIEIQAQYLKVTTDPKTKEFSKLYATGKPAKFSQQIDWSGNMVISRGNDIRYLTSESKLEIRGDGYLSRMKNKITADYILYMINDGTFSAQKQDSGRVFMTLQPKTPTEPEKKK